MRELREKIDTLSSRYVKVEIDGVIKGIAYIDDIREQVFYENGRRKIKKVFLNGRTQEVRIGINLYPATVEDLFAAPLDEVRYRTRNYGIEHATGFEDKEDEKLPKPLVSWNQKSGIIRIENDETKQSAEKEVKKQGLFYKICRWLKGDICYRR